MSIFHILTFSESEINLNSLVQELEKSNKVMLLSFILS